MTAMRKYLLSATLLAGCLSGAPAQAQLGIPVFDSSNLLQQLKELFQESQAYVRQGEQLAREAQTAATTLSTLNALVQNPNLGAAMGLMQMAGLGSALPVNPFTVQSLVSGTGGLQGKLGSLSALMNSSFTSNSIYTCTDASWACQQQKQNANGLAGQQGIGMNAIQTQAAHIPVLQALRDRLSTSTTPAERENAMAALQAETAWGVQENNRLTAVNIMMASQKDIREQQSNEQLSKSFDKFIASVPPPGG
jgi:Type IV secretion system proteins